MQKRYLLLSVFVLGAFLGFAQHENILPASVEKMKMDWLWEKTTNAAGIQLDPVKNYSLISASYGMENGNFHRVMDGEKRERLKFGAEGGVHVNGFYFRGKFDYSRDAIKEAMFNASLIDPYRRMPYFVADTNSSNWNNQHYRLEFKIGFPTIGEHLLLGLAGNYHASMGAKQRDIRTENYFLQLTLRPGAVFLLNPRNRIGLNLEYFSLKEESNMGNVNVYIDQPYYKMYGLGKAIIGIGSGRTTNYIGNGLGGSIQYNHSGAVDLLLSTGYTLKVEEATVSFFNPRKEGSVLDHIWQNRLYLRFKGEECTHYLEMDYLQRKVKGIEYVTKYDDSESFKGYLTLGKNIRSTYADRLFHIAYSWADHCSDGYKHLFGGEFSFAAIDDRYIFPQSNKTVSNLSLALFAKRNLLFSEKLSKKLLLGVKLMYGKNIKNEYVYGGAFKDDPIASRLEKMDTAYHGSDFYGSCLTAVYSRNLSTTSGLQPYISADFTYRRSRNHPFHHRTIFFIGIGCNF